MEIAARASCSQTGEFQGEHYKCIVVWLSWHCPLFSTNPYQLEDSFDPGFVPAILFMKKSRREQNFIFKGEAVFTPRRSCLPGFWAFLTFSKERAHPPPAGPPVGPYRLCPGQLRGTILLDWGLQRALPKPQVNAPWCAPQRWVAGKAGGGGAELR